MKVEVQLNRVIGINGVARLRKKLFSVIKHFVFDGLQPKLKSRGEIY